MLDSLRLKYPFFHRTKYVVILTALGILLFQLFNVNNPQQMVGRVGKTETWSAYIWFVLIDQFLIELISMFILFKAIVLYARYLKLQKLSLSTLAVVRYELSFLPLFLVIFFVFNPITQTIRFFYEQYPAWQASVFWQHYWYNLRTYLVYLAPVLLIGYLMLNTNLIIEYVGQIKTSKSAKDEVLNQVVTTSITNEEGVSSTKPQEYASRVIALDKGYEKPLAVQEVYWFEVIERQYYAVTQQGSYRVQKNINELETLLNPATFLRINRSVIINIDKVDKFSPYFNGKYILKMKGFAERDFVVPKARVKSLKQSLVL